MQEFDSIKVSAYEAERLADQLTDRSADGWSVVSIVSAGSDVVAYLSRPGGSSAAPAAEPADTGAGTGAATDVAPATAEPAAEPAGWGSEPAAPAASEPAAGWGVGASTDSTATTDASGGEWGTADTGAAAASAPAGGGEQTAAGGTAPSVPPGWYQDPSGRFELRYWDGAAWTEHTSRGGQQYTDPPVA